MTCGHHVEQAVYHTNKEPSFSTQWCPSCEMTRGVVKSEKIIEASARMAEAKRKREDKVARAEAEEAVTEAQRRLAELRSEK